MIENKLCAVIMCGGSGTRFWPASRKKTPKQFLRLNETSSLIQETVKRLEGLIPNERIFLLAAESHKEYLERHLPDIPTDNYILEPSARNTGPALALAARRLESISPDLIMAALPADHAIKDVKGFCNTLEIAAKHAVSGESIVTIGIKPDAPETGYGYIEIGENVSETVRSVVQFVEKPKLKKAQEYLESGRYVWNAGIFVTRVDVLSEGFRKYEPAIYKNIWEKVPAWGNPGHDSLLRDIYPKLNKVSIDFAIMEKAESVTCVPAQFDWNDLGSWNALEKYWGQDKQGNSANTKYYAIESKGNIISGTGRDIALIGVEDMIVVERGDVVMICKKERSQEVKEMIAILEKNKRDDLL